MPPIRGMSVRGHPGARDTGVTSKHTVLPACADCAAILHQPLFSLFRTHARTEQSAFRGPRTLRDDVNDSIDRVCPPHGSARSPNDFDAIDVFERDVLLVPVDAREAGCI